MSTDTLKTAICDALATWIRQRPCFEQDTPGADRREVARDKRDAETLLQAVRRHDAITGEKLLEASRSTFEGRLKITVNLTYPKADQIKINYIAGQYRPTEYRAAAAAVLAAALWGYMRDNMPDPTYKQYGSATDHPMRTESLYEGKSAGDWLRRSFRKEFGSALQRRWFN